MYVLVSFSVVCDFSAALISQCLKFRSRPAGTQSLPLHTLGELMCCCVLAVVS